MPDAHAEHWKEPSAVTAERPKGERVCESCGEVVPWHGASCAMLKNAHKRRFAKCSFCAGRLLVGEQMYAHVEAEHQEELKKLLYGKES